MAPSAVDSRGVMINDINGDPNGHNGFARSGSYDNIDTMNPHDHVRFDPSLEPKRYQMKGTDPNSKVLFQDVKIVDSTGRDPFRGNVYIAGKQTPDRGTGAHID